MKKLTLLFIVLFTTFYSCYAQLPSEIDTVRNTSIEPYNKICFLYIHRKRWPKTDGWFKSTGFLIDKNTILTAAHNIHNSFFSKVDSIKIFPAKYLNKLPYGSIEISGKTELSKTIVTHPNYKFSNRSNKRIKWDFGIIRIPQEKNHLSIQQNFEPSFFLDTTFYSLSIGDTLHVAGYPADPKKGYNGDFMTTQYDTCSNILDKKFTHSLVTTTGNSGSPVWVEDNNKIVLVGIHTFGFAGTFLDEENYKLLIEWLQQSKNEIK